MINNKLLRLLLHPRAAVVVHDLVVVIIAWVFARWFMFKLQASAPVDLLAVQMIPEFLAVLLIQGAVLWATGLYKGLWRFASFPDLWNIVKASLAGAILISGGLFIFGMLSKSYAVAVLTYPLLLFVGLGLPRMCYRFFKDSRISIETDEQNVQQVLIIGAGRSGALLVKELRRRGGFRILGFLDDNPRLRDAQVHGVPVLGPVSFLPKLGDKLGIQLVIIAIPSATNQQMQRIVEVCERTDIEFRTLPILQDLGNKAIRISDFKRVMIDDLLGREPVSLDWDSIRDGLAGKRVMITGGGGSIGAELCRQIARLGPTELVVIDHGEYALYRIDHELRSDHTDLVFRCILGDICDPATVEKVVSEYRPDVIFHAAAYKHLPILQTQVREAFRNNVLGTIRMAEAAERHQVDTFVLISTDKAVNPANIMGATKRVAEMYCQSVNLRSATRYITVRFGNVLNSNGSVVPLFKEQIEKGGPVTVTHPEISRYFMTISEASQLIMQAAVLGQGGEIFVLDMGEPVKIAYLAEQLIRLAGKVPGEDIQIIYTGLRPGEKLYEELFHELEPYEHTQHEKILLAHPRQADWQSLSQVLRKSELAVRQYDTAQLYEILLQLVPEFPRTDLLPETTHQKVVRLPRSH